MKVWSKVEKYETVGRFLYFFSVLNRKTKGIYYGAFFMNRFSTKQRENIEIRALVLLFLGWFWFGVAGVFFSFGNFLFLYLGV